MTLRLLPPTRDQQGSSQMLQPRTRVPPRCHLAQLRSDQQGLLQVSDLKAVAETQ